MFVIYKNKGINLEFVTKFIYEDNQNTGIFRIKFYFIHTDTYEEFNFANKKDVNYAYIKIVDALEQNKKFLKF